MLTLVFSGYIDDLNELRDPDQQRERPGKPERRTLPSGAYAGLRQGPCPYPPSWVADNPHDELYVSLLLAFRRQK